MSADWSAVPAPVPYANLTNPQTLNLYAIVSDNPETYADLDGHEPDGATDAQDSATDGAPPQCPVEGCPVYEIDYADGPLDTSQAENNAEARANATTDGTATQENLALAWLNVIEVSGSYGFGVGVTGQAGTTKGDLVAGTEVEGTLGLGGHTEVETFTGVKASGQIGPAAQGEVKAGLTASTQDGLSLNAQAHGSIGSLTGGVKADKNGVHADAGTQKTADSKIGAHVHAGLGIGININLSQAHRAAQATAASFRALGAFALGVLKGDIPSYPFLP